MLNLTDRERSKRRHPSSQVVVRCPQPGCGGFMTVWDEPELTGQGAIHHRSCPRCGHRESWKK